MLQDKQTIIKIPYTPRYPQDEIHPQLDKHRFSVLVAHRRLGKTVLVINQIIKRALTNTWESPRYAYMAPLLKQAKLIAWDYLKKYTQDIPGVKINESELIVELPPRTGKIGARIYVFGADNPDALRGTYLDGAVLDEYGQMKPEIFSEIIRPTLADRGGWAIFIGTPKGQNQFFDVHNLALRQMSLGDKTWWTKIYRADETKVISDDELGQLMQTSAESTYRQEFMCDFSASSDNVLLTIDEVLRASTRSYTPGELVDSEIVVGVDPARYGDDRSVISVRCGLQADDPIIFKGMDNMTLVGELCNIVDRIKPDAIFIDAGRGEGVIDRMRQLGYSVFEINFGGVSSNAHYCNKRTEMWMNMKKWLLGGGAICDNTELRGDLITPTYDFDAKNRMRLETKDSIRERIGRSPDLGDSLCFVEGTKITTPNGNINIEDLCCGDIVVTPYGNRKILKVWESFTDKLTTVRFSDGKELIGKPEHKIFTWEKGWITLDSLSLFNTIESDNLTRRILWFIRNLFFIREINIGFKQQVDIIAQVTNLRRKDFFTEEFGQTRMEKFLKDTLSIIRTVIGQTIDCQTLYVSNEGIMPRCILKKDLRIKNTKKRTDYSLSQCAKRQRSGIDQRMAESGTLNMAKKAGLAENKLEKSVAFVRKNMTHTFLQDQDSVLGRVCRKKHTLDIKHQLTSVLSAAKNLLLTNIGLKNIVPISVQTQTVEKIKTYNLSVDTDNVYYANGILVANCLTFALPVMSRAMKRRMQKTQPQFGIR